MLAESEFVSHFSCTKADLADVGKIKNAHSESPNIVFEIFSDPHLSIIQCKDSDPAFDRDRVSYPAT